MIRTRPLLSLVFRAALWGAVGVQGALLGCASSTAGSGDPLVDVRGQGLSEESRVAAVDRAWEGVEAGTLDRSRVRDEFKKDVWLAGTGDAVRLRMVQRLIADTGQGAESDTTHFLALRLPTERAWPIIELVAKESAERGWVEMTPALVRSYARKVPDPIDEQRPERAALLKLHPGKEIEEIVYDVFIGAATKHGGGAGEPRATAPGAKESLPMGAASATRSGKEMLEQKVQSDSWELLVRLDKDGSRRAALLANDARVTGAAGQDPILVDLRAAASDLKAVPVTGPELEWVRTLRSPGNTANAAWWAAARAAIATLTPEQAAGLEIRHAEPVRWASLNRPEWMLMSRDQLRSELTSRLNTHKTYGRGADRNDVLDTPPATIPAWDPKLSWGDLLTILVLDDALAEPSVRNAILEQASADRANKQTEFGGALEAIWPGGDAKRASPSDGSGAFDARLYLPPVPPRVIPSSDSRFVASEQMIASTPRSVAHYHFHVQNEQNGEYAGPSTGDLDYAASYARNCLVFTSIDDGVLNVDYYQRNGACIDLGEVRR
jgi:hypothetical protein